MVVAMRTRTHSATRRTGAVVSLAAALGASALLSCAVASAGAGHPGNPSIKVGVQTPKAMKLQTSPDEKVNRSGTQGDMRTSAVQGTVESALQCDSTSSIAKVSCDTPSEEAAPQVKPK
jgi:hypothetical protein